MPPDHVAAVTEALHELLNLGGALGRIPVTNFGAWRNNDWLGISGGTEVVTEYNSVDWYLAMGRLASARNSQLYAGEIISSLLTEPWQRAQPHYDVLLTKQDLYDQETNFVVGLAVPSHCTVISTYRFGGLGPRLQRECIKTVAMHEIGHVFGLPAQGRTQDTKKSLGAHCTNRCVMRQGLEVPTDFIAITEDRLAGHVLCHRCMDDLWRHFSFD